MLEPTLMVSSVATRSIPLPLGPNLKENNEETEGYDS